MIQLSPNDEILTRPIELAQSNSGIKLSLYIELRLLISLMWIQPGIYSFFGILRSSPLNDF